MAKIAMLGAGNSGHALAVDSKLGGHEVRMFEFSEYTKMIDGIMESGEIELVGPELNAKNFRRNGRAALDLITTDMKKAVEGVDHIMISVRATGYERLFRELIPHLEDGQVVTFFPDNYGSLILRRMMREMDCRKEIIVAGWSSLPYGARLIDYGEMNTVYIMYRAINLRFDTIPSCDADRYAEAAKSLPPLDSVDFERGDTVLDIGFSNVNPILHVPATLLNAGAVDNWGIIEFVGTDSEPFNIYKHGFSKHVGNIQWEIYQEEVRTAEAMGVGIQPYDKEVFYSRTSILGPEYMGEGFSIPYEESISNENWMKFLPGDRFEINHRYVTEDIPVGCSIFYHLAKRQGLQCPTIESMISIASTMNEVDYFTEGFDLNTLGIDGMNNEELGSYLRKGII